MIFLLLRRGLISKQRTQEVRFQRTITLLKMGTELNREFLTEEYQMTEKHLKTCSTSLVIREMQIKRTLRFHLTSIKMTKIKNSGDHKCRGGCGGRGTLLHCWWDCKLVQPLQKSVSWFLRKLGMILLKDPVILLLGIYPEDS